MKFLIYNEKLEKAIKLFVQKYCTLSLFYLISSAITLKFPATYSSMDMDFSLKAFHMQTPRTLKYEAKRKLTSNHIYLSISEQHSAGHQPFWI
jgi:hypothetical protein